MEFEIPELKKLSKISYIYEGGISLPPELIALVLALSLYTSTFVAECVRAGIEGVSKGQKEAAASVGLTPNQVLKSLLFALHFFNFYFFVIPIHYCCNS